jgi:uncharacterized protein YecE (DUF72 family)
MKQSGRIRIGIGGWTYEPWRETFYPADLPKKSELHYASRAVTAIEINGTFYRLQTPSVFAKWRDDTPDDFVFTVKAPRYIVSRKNLADNGESIQKFLTSGLDQLSQKLGAIMWQLAPTKKFDEAEIEAFFDLMPATLGKHQLRHAIEVRHTSFVCEAFVELARKHEVAIVYTHSGEYPGVANITANFVYARLRQSVANEPTGYPKSQLNEWKERAELWSQGHDPADLPRIQSAACAETARDVFIFFINGAKERAPAAAQHLISILPGGTS